MIKFLVIFSLMITSSIQLLYSQESTNQIIEKEAQIFVNNIEINYGPLQLKKQTIGLDWEKQKADFFKTIQSAKNSSEAYLAMVHLLSSLKDAHVSSHIPSSLKVVFNIQFTPVNQKILLSFLKNNLQSEPACEAKPGDALESISNVKIDTILNSLSINHNIGNQRSTNELNVYQLSKWTEQSGLIALALKDNLNNVYGKFDFIQKDSNKKISCLLKGKLSGNALFSIPFQKDTTNEQAKNQVEQELERLVSISAQPKKKEETKKILLQIQNIFNKQNDLANLKSPFIDNEDEIEINESISDSEVADGKIFALGQKKPVFQIPYNFKRIGAWGAGFPIIGSPFARASGLYAGVFKYNNKRIGILRIPSYMPKSETMMIFSNLSFRTIFNKLEKNTDLLIIDQMHNPGGAVILSDWLVSNLVGELDQSKHLKFAIRPRGHWLEEFESILLEMKKTQSDLEESKPDEIWMANHYLKQMQEELVKVYAAHSRGDYFSEPISLNYVSSYLNDTIDSLFLKLHNNEKTTALGKFVNFLYPLHMRRSFTRTQTYTKPVYMLIDALDFSGGDATPAVLQDYGRVKLVGVNTAGAGGTVEEFTSTGFLPFEYSLTTSLMIRPGGVTVENTGVKPDIPFELNEDDILTGYKNFLPRLLQTLGI